MISSCCGVETLIPELSICPQCYNHCEFEEAT